MPIKADKSLRAYYNEIDPFAAQWIRNLMAEGWITKGDVDERSIEDVQPNDIAGYDRLHFFAGVAVWDYALNQAGWGRGEIWTGSCPCQPFSAAGQGAGFADERHLWPAFHHLIKECRPTAVLGEQVASKNAEPWIDLVHTDLEALGYAFGAIPFPASSVGAPNIRDRLYWVANSANERQHGRRPGEAGNWGDATRVEPERLCDAGGLADTERYGGGSQAAPADHGQPQAVRPADWAGGRGGLLGGLADACSERRVRGQGIQAGSVDDGAYAGRVEGDDGLIGVCETCDDGHAAGPTNGLWADADWLLCRDGRWRPVEPGTSPLAHGAAQRMGRLRAYGSSINAKAAQAFIESVM